MAKAQKGETYAVVGYVADEVAKSLGSQGPGRALEVRIDRGNDNEVVRIPADAIAGVLQGASQGKETSVQVLLKPGAEVETVYRGAARDLHLRPISDVSLIFKRLPINVIYVDPILTTRLTELAKTKG